MQDFTSPILIMYRGAKKEILWAKTLNVTERMNFGYLAFSNTGHFLIALTQFNNAVEMLTIDSSTGALLNSKALRSVFPFSSHKSIIVNSNTTHPTAYMGSEFYYTNNQTYRYELSKFSLLNESALVDTLFYLRSTNSTAEN